MRKFTVSLENDFSAFILKINDFGNILLCNLLATLVIYSLPAMKFRFYSKY